MSESQPTMFELAFEEYRVTRQISTGHGEPYCSMVGVKGESMPAWFVRDELGYDDGPVGTRLRSMVAQETLDLRHQERARREAVPPPAQPKHKRKHKRETKASRRAKLEQLEARALMRWAS
jgi:hypothetical protein